MNWTYTNAVGVSASLSNGTTLVVEGYEGDGLPPADILTRRTPQRRGAEYVATRVREKPLTVLQQIRAGGSVTTFQNVCASMSALLDPRNGMGYLTVVTDVPNTRVLDCILNEPYTVPAIAGADRLARVPLTFLAMDPYWRDASATTVNFLAGGTGGGITFPLTFPLTFTPGAAAVMGSLYTLTNAGSAPSAPTVTITGPLVNPVVYSATAGKGLFFDGDLAASETLTIDMRPGYKTWSLTRAGTTFNQTPPLTSDSRFWELAPGANYIIITGDNPLVGGTATLSYYTRYLTLGG